MIGVITNLPFHKFHLLKNVVVLSSGKPMSSTQSPADVQCLKYPACIQLPITLQSELTISVRDFPTKF